MSVEIAIIGGGLVGGSLAVALADAGLTVALVDPRSGPVEIGTEFDPRVFALRPSSREFLARCGVWRYVDETRVAPIYRMMVTGDDGKSRLTFDAYRSGLRELAVIVEDSNLQSAVQHALNDRPLVSQLRGRSCADAHWEDDCVTIMLDDRQRIVSQLAVAADGSNSRLRELAGIAVEASPYGQRGVVANFRTTIAHQGTAHQWFRADGVLALLPLPGDMVSMVWSTADAHARELTGLDAGELAQRVTVASAAILGELSAVSLAASFQLRLMRAKSTVAPRLALVGDAAHNVHPLAGQGLNLGLADAQALAGLLAGRSPGENAGSRALLARYRRARAEETAAMQLTTDGLYRLFESAVPGVAWLRNAGLRMTEHFPPLKRLLVKRAAG